MTRASPHSGPHLTIEDRHRDLLLMVNNNEHVTWERSLPDESRCEVQAGTYVTAEVTVQGSRTRGRPRKFAISAEEQRDVSFLIIWSKPYESKADEFHSDVELRIERRSVCIGNARIVLLQNFKCRYAHCNSKIASCMGCKIHSSYNRQMCVIRFVGCN